MSIVGLALRISAIQALKSADTLAGNRWFDSALLPIDQIAKRDGTQPFGSVSTEDEGDRPSGRDLNAGSRTIDLVIEIAFAAVVPLPAESEDGDLLAIEITETDANLELAVAVLTRQIAACLWGRGGGEWGAVFRALSATIVETKSRRGVPVENGQRFAARQMIYSLQPIAEPPFDAPLIEASPLNRFLMAVEADQDLAIHAQVIRAAIEGKPLDWPSIYDRSALAGGYTDAEGSQIGLGGDDHEPIVEVTVLPDGWIVDDETGDELYPEAEP